MEEWRTEQTFTKRNSQWLWLKPACKLSIAALALFLLFIAYGILPNRWYHALYVYSGSMSPTIESGDVIIITPPPAKLMPGMIVTLQVDKYLVTHRVVDLQSNGQFSTKGDSNIDEDEWGNANVKLVGVYRARIPYLGYVFAAMQDLMKINASGAWFVDRESLKLQINLGSQKEIDTATSTEIPAETETPPPYWKPSPSAISTQKLTNTPEASETSAITSTPMPTITEVTSTPSLEPTETEPPVSPTHTPTETEQKPTETINSPEPTLTE